MNKEMKELSIEQQAIVFHGNDMLWSWRELVRADKDGRGWHERTARQAYQDCMISLKRVGLIEGYDVVDVQVKINGKWWPQRMPVRFIKSKT